MTYVERLVQAINNLGNGTGLNVTIARWLTPSGKDINAAGIVPDFEVKLSQADINAGKGFWWLDLTTGKPKSIGLYRYFLQNHWLGDVSIIITNRRNHTQART